MPNKSGTMIPKCPPTNYRSSARNPVASPYVAATHSWPTSKHRFRPSFHLTWKGKVTPTHSRFFESIVRQLFGVVAAIMVFFQCYMAVAQTTVFSESFEGAWPNSWVVGNDSGVTTAKWGDNSAKHYAGSWSGFCADPGGDAAVVYPNNLHTTMERQNVSLVGYNTANLEFHCYCNTEYGYDKLTVNVKNGGTWSAPLLTLQGSSGGWQFYSVNLSAYAGLSGLTIQFRFDSDIRTTNEGVWLDDIVLSATPGGAISATVKDTNGYVFTGPASVSRYNSSFGPIDSKSTSGGVAIWSNVPTGTYNLEVYSNGEFWGAAQTTVTQNNTANVVIQRSEPYATKFATKLGTSDITGQTVLAESTLTHEVTVRNATKVSQTARVLLQVDRSQSSPYDFAETTAAQTISAGDVTTFYFSQTPSSSGTYYRYLEVWTLVGSFWVKTDSYGWGEPLTVNPYRGDLSVTVKDNSGSVFTGPAQVIRFDSGYSSIDSITPSGGKAFWPNIPQGSYNLELYSNSELWVKMTASVVGGQTSNITLQRNQPLALFFKTFYAGNDITGQIAYSDAALTHTIRVCNNAGLSRKTTVRIMLDRDKLSPYDSPPLTLPFQVISNGGFADYSFSNQLSEPGIYYRQLDVLTEDTLGNWVKTDSYSWGEPLNVISILKLTHFPVAGKGLDSPIINSVFDHESREGEIYDWWGDFARGIPPPKSDPYASKSYVSAKDVNFPGRNPSYPGGKKIAYDNHHGIDYHGAIGDPVVAAASGKITAYYAYDRQIRGSFGRNCGNYVEITHAGGYKTRYLHLSSVDNRIFQDILIKGGEEIGRIGGSGGAIENEFKFDAVDTHLHFELKVNSPSLGWKPIDPYGWRGSDIADPYVLLSQYHYGCWQLLNKHMVGGQVFDASGGSVAGVQVTLEPLGVLSPPDNQILHTITSESGEYRFSGVSDGTSYTVSVSPQSGFTGAPPQTFTNAVGDSFAMFSISSSIVSPQISSNPQSITVTLGELAAFQVKARGSGPFSYQWRKGGTAIPGATTAELLITAVSTEDNGGTYDAVVSNLGGSVITNSAVLTVNQPPVIAGEPVQSVPKGGATATWQVTVGDAETDVAALVVSATSLNEQLLPASSLTINGSGETRTITAVVPSNAVGNVDLVASVRDVSGAEASLMLHLTISADNDDHGNSIASASSLPDVGYIAGILTTGDEDFFRINIQGPGVLIAWTECAIDTYGYIYAPDQTQMEEDNDSDRQANFRVSVAVTSGTYYVRVRGNSADTVGEYTLHARFISTTEPIQVSYLEKVDDNINLGFAGSAGTTYYILGSDDLKTWTLIVTVVGTGAENYATLIGQGSQSSRYFRVSPAPPPSPVPADFVLIAAGQFTMGDTLDGDLNAIPHPVIVSAFFAQQQETTKAEWDEVRSWGLLHGYTDISAGDGKAPNHPVLNVTWYDVLKWCNARSEKEHLNPCYYTNSAHTVLYKNGLANMNNSMVSLVANGYRLPTEAEWEKAARGGLSGKRFPWGDTIAHSQVNYFSNSAYIYDVGTTRGHHPNYATGLTPYTSPVGSFAANGYGLYDMAGNAWEWCWDWFSGNYYESSTEIDPLGPDSGTNRVVRGGNWHYYAYNCRVAYRVNYGSGDGFDKVGFRTVRSFAP